MLFGPNMNNVKAEYRFVCLLIINYIKIVNMAETDEYSIAKFQSLSAEGDLFLQRGSFHEAIGIQHL
jgi:hypothetical protein